MDAQSTAREPGKVRSSNLQALCDAAGNSASSSRKWTRVEPPAAIVSQRSSEDAKPRIIISKNLTRRGKRTPG